MKAITFSLLVDLNFEDEVSDLEQVLVQSKLFFCKVKDFFWGGDQI